MGSSRKQRSAESLGASLETVVARQLYQTLGRGQTVTVALSGGVDSIVLLDVLRAVAPRLGLRLRALHVNHGLSPNASVWSRFCGEHCRRRGIEFKAVAVTVGGSGSNVEAEARAARYRVFAEYGSEVLALAHTRDDQAETVLLNLLRGAGVKGLAAMPAVRGLASGAARRERQCLIRPLLQFGRADILAWARRRRLRWIEDESNAEERFARNFLRRQVLPVLEQRFPGCRVSIARAAAHVSEAAGLLDELGSLDCAQVVRNGRISARALRELTPQRAANVLRVFLAERGQAILSTARVRELLRQLTTQRVDANPRVELPFGVLRRYRGWIQLLRKEEDIGMTPEPLVWRGERRLCLGDAGVLLALETLGDGVSAARLEQEEVTVRRREGGERIRLKANRPTLSMKNLLQELGVPPWERVRMPLVYCGEQLVWAPKVGVALEFLARAHERAWRFAWEAPVAN